MCLKLADNNSRFGMRVVQVGSQRPERFPLVSEPKYVQHANFTNKRVVQLAKDEARHDGGLVLAYQPPHVRKILEQPAVVKRMLGEPLLARVQRAKRKHLQAGEEAKLAKQAYDLANERLDACPDKRSEECRRLGEVVDACSVARMAWESYEQEWQGVCQDLAREIGEAARVYDAEGVESRAKQAMEEAGRKKQELEKREGEVLAMHAEAAERQERVREKEQQVSLRLAQLDSREGALNKDPLTVAKEQQMLMTTATFEFKKRAMDEAMQSTVVQEAAKRQAMCSLLGVGFTDLGSILQRSSSSCEGMSALPPPLPPPMRQSLGSVPQQQSLWQSMPGSSVSASSMAMRPQPPCYPPPMAPSYSVGSTPLIGGVSLGQSLPYVAQPGVLSREQFRERESQRVARVRGEVEARAMQGGEHAALQAPCCYCSADPKLMKNRQGHRGVDCFKKHPDLRYKSYKSYLTELGLQGWM